MALEIVSEAPTPSIGTKDDFSALMDKTFGKGKWSLGGGYRSQERENELRAEGAGTVAAGHLSDHSKGTPDAPGAYDVQVEGLNPRQVARKLAETGADFVHFYPEGQRANQGAHLHVSVPPGDGSKPLSIVSETPIAAEPKPAAAKPSMLGALAEGFADIPREIGKQLGEVSDAKAARNKAKLAPKSLLREFVDTATDTNALHDVLDPIGAVIGGAATSILGRPVEKATGGLVPKRVAGDVASIALPIAGELNEARQVANLGKEAGVGYNAARQMLTQQRAAAMAPKLVSRGTTTPAKPTLPELSAAIGPANAVKALAQPVDAAHAARVARLEKEGVFVTPGSKLGGSAKIIEDASTSNPQRGQAVVDARNHSIRTMNTALYNRALAPIGARVPDALKVGRDGIGYVGKQLGAAYDQLLPKINVAMDDETIADLAALEKASDKIGIPEGRQFREIVNQDVLHHLPIGEVSDGRTFKAVQSDLLRWSRELKGNPDGNKRRMGHMIDDVLDALTASAERSSPPGVRDQLKKVNTGFAIFTRIQDAATRRLVTSPGADPGTITPTDLVAAVKKGDRTVRKGAFARGDALLQKFAEDAEAVLPSKVSDSGTATRLNVTRPGLIGAGVGGAIGGIPGAAAGAAAGVADQAINAGTNSLARRVLMPSARPAPMVRNYLRAAQRRLEAHHAARAGIAAAAAADLSDRQ